MKRPDEVKLSQQEGEALIDRIQASNLEEEDRRVMVKLIRLYFWLTFVLQETKISLKRLKTALFGDGKGGRGKRTQNGPGEPDGWPSAESPSQGKSGTEPKGKETAASDEDRGEEREEADKRDRLRGHGRMSAQRYVGARKVVCRHEDLEPGQRCPACGRGRLYPLPSGVEIRIDGHGLLEAIHYELEKLRCSACGQVFTAPLPQEAGEEKYHARARAVLALGRYYLGLPFYRIEHYQALLGVPISDATQWDQVERVADCAYPVYECLKELAAQGEVIYQDDTHVRILSLLAENQQREDGERTGIYTTALVVQQGEHTIELYFSGRAHAGENLEAVLALRDVDRDAPIVMSDALSVNEVQEPVIRCHCLAHGQRQFTEIEEVFPQECDYVIAALKEVFQHEETTRLRQMTPEQRLAYHQTHSGPVMKQLCTWLEKQFEDRTVEPNSSLGKAFQYLLNHWDTLSRFLQVAGAPIENNIVERALKLMIRQRKNSLFYASTHSAYVASVLTSLIQTCVQAGVNALEYLVSLQVHRDEVFKNPAAWLPWNYQDNRATL